jgi:methionyl-tRNA synthetase
MSARRFTVTAALPYSNGRLHVGHIAGAYLPADVYVRYLRSRGDDVIFICGSDDYGVPVALTARKEGKSPGEVNEHYRARQKADFDGLGIDFTIYSGTNNTELHHRISQDFFLKVLENGYLEKRTQNQLYDPEAEVFLPDRYVEGVCHHCGADGARGDQCEACGKQIEPTLLVDPRSMISGARPEVRETTHWFFKLSAFRDRLREWAGSHEEWRPMVRNFTMGLLASELPDRAITRDLDWGIPVPLEDDPDAEGKVLYVWFDAPIGYVSFTAQWCQEQGGDWRDYEKWWKSPETKIIHFIGQDNVVFHTVMWPATLMAEGSFQLPANVPANCFLNIQFPGEEEEKMSKSRGTAVWIEDYLRQYEPDALRYYLSQISLEGQDAAFKFDDFVSRNNDELVAALGNLVYRTITFVHRYFDGRVPARGDTAPEDDAQLAMIAGLPDVVSGKLERFRFKAGIERIMAAARQSNRYFDHQQPWAQRKSDPAACGTSINVLLCTIKTLGVVMEPYLPFAAEKVARMLALEAGERRWDNAAEHLPEGRALGEAEILFKKLDPAAILGE